MSKLSSSYRLCVAVASPGRWEFGSEKSMFSVTKAMHAWWFMYGITAEHVVVPGIMAISPNRDGHICPPQYTLRLMTPRASLLSLTPPPPGTRLDRFVDGSFRASREALSLGQHRPTGEPQLILCIP